MSFNADFPDELIPLILYKADSTSLLNAMPVCTKWAAVIRAHFKSILFNQYFQTHAISNSALDTHFIVSIDADLAKRIENFVLQLQKNQIGIFTVIFPFNSESTFKVRIGSTLKNGDCATDECVNKDADKREFVIFQKVIPLTRSADLPPAFPLTLYSGRHTSLCCYKARLPSKFMGIYRKINSDLTFAGFPALFSMIDNHYSSKNEN